MTIDEIQASYIADLRSVVPKLRDWWKDLVDRLGEEGAYERWPTGPSGHPIVLEIFRQHSFSIEELNDEAQERFEPPPDPEPEELWGRDERGEAPREERAVDWLIHFIEDDAPDLYLLALGIVFVPIGLDQNDESV